MRTSSRFLIFRRPGGGLTYVLPEAVDKVDDSGEGQCVVWLRGAPNFQRVQEPAGDVVRAIDRWMGERG